MTRQVFRDDLAGSRMTRESWDHYQYESHKTPTFTPAQIPSHITVHHNSWSHDYKQKPICMPPPIERNFRYATPHWKNQRKEFGYMHNNYEQNNYFGPRWHHKDLRHRPFVPRLNETENVAKGASKGYNPSRFRYVSESYLRSLKENNITCSQTSQQRNVQIAVIKPIARVENLKDNEMVSNCQVASDKQKDGKNEDISESCGNEGFPTKKDGTILEVLDCEAVSSEIFSTNEANEEKNENNIDSNFMELKPNVSALLKSDSNFSHKDMQGSSNSKIEQSLKVQEVNKKSDATKLVVLDEGEINLTHEMANLFDKQSLGGLISETKDFSKQENVDNNFNKKKDFYDPLISYNELDNSAKQYKEKIIQTIEPLNQSDKSNHTSEATKHLASKKTSNTSKLIVAPEATTLHSPVKCCSSRESSDECLSHREPSEDKKLTKIMKCDGPEYLSEKPLSTIKNLELQITQRINENDLHGLSFQTLDQSPSDKNFQSLNSDVLTPEMLRERLFRKFINSSELIIPVENEVVDQDFLMEREKTIESLMTSTFKMAGIFHTEFKEPRKQDKPSLSIKTEDSISSCVSTSNNTEDQKLSKQLKPKSKIESCADSFNKNLPLNFFNEKTLKNLSNKNLFGNLDIHFLKDILAKIETPSKEPNNTMKKTSESDLNCENSSFQNIYVTKNPKINPINNTEIKSDHLNVESYKCKNMMSPEKTKSAASINEEMDTSLMLNLESVEECMLNSVSVVCLQSEIWESNDLKKDANCIKSEIGEQSHATETNTLNKVETDSNRDLNKTELESKIKCEKSLDTLKNLGSKLEESYRAEGNVKLDTKIVPMCNSSFNTCSSNNENLPKAIDEELLTIEHNLNQIFGMKEESDLKVPEIQPTNVNSEHNNLKLIDNAEPLTEDVQSSALKDLLTQTEPKCKSIILENDKSIPKISSKSGNDDDKKDIEYLISLKEANKDDSISISSDEVGDGDDCFPGEELFYSLQHKDDSKLIHENQGADEELEINRKTSLNKKGIDNKDNDIEITSNLGNTERDEFDFNNNKTDFVEYDTKFSGFVKSKIKVYESNGVGKTFETDDDLPDLNKTNLEKSFYHETKEPKENNVDRKDVDIKSVFGSFNSEQVFVSGKSDLQKTDILKWKVSQKRTCIFSKENLQSLQVTGSPINGFQTKSDVNYFFSGITTESIKCESGNDVSFQKKSLLDQVKCNINKITNNSPVKLKRLCESDFNENLPRKKVNIKTSLKCRPKDRKRKVNRASTCLSPKSLSKALETASYVIEDEVSNICPLGHLLEKCYSTVNVNTDRISLYCNSCKKYIFMGERT